MGHGRPGGGPVQTVRYCKGHAMTCPRADTRARGGDAQNGGSMHASGASDAAFTARSGRALACAPPAC